MVLQKGRHALTQKRIYFISLSFPPLGRGASLTNSCLAKGLSQKFKVNVITAGELKTYFLSYNKDYSLLKDIPTHIEIIRIKPFEWFFIGEGLYRFGLIPCYHLNWAISTIKKIKTIFTKSGIILSSYPVVSNLLVGLWAKKKTDFPLIIDFRDDYLGVMSHYMNPSGKMLASYIEKNVVKKADRITVATEGIKDALIKRYPDLTKKIDIIYNLVPFDSNSLSSIKDENKKNKLFTMIYAGNFSPAQEVKLLIKGINRLLDIHPELKGKIVFKLFGPENRYLKKKIIPLLNNEIRYEGYAERNKLIKEIKRADVGLFSLSNKTFSYATPTKLFEFIELEVPILAMLPKGSAREIIEKDNIGLVCDPNDIDGFARNIYSLFRNESLRKKIVKNIKKIKDHYSFSTQINRWINVIEEL